MLFRSAAIKRAIANVTKFHEEQMPKTWLTNRPYGAMLGQKVTPVDSVGIYVPGGTAAYPSSVIMNACPAKVAGVPRIVMAVPCGKDGKDIAKEQGAVGADKVRAGQSKEDAEEAG